MTGQINIEEKKFELFINREVEVEPMLSYLDSMTLICRVSHKSFNTIKEILEEFSEFICLQVNLWQKQDNCL